MERRVPEGSLGHPDSEMVPLRQFLSQNAIETEADLRQYLQNTLPKNKDGHILVPQINMRHKDKETTLKTPDVLVLRVEDELRAEVIGLKVMIAECTDDNKKLKEELSEVREAMLDRSDGYLALQEAHGKLIDRLEDMESLLAIYSLQIKELKEEKADMEASRCMIQNEHEQLVRRLLPILRMIPKEEEKSEPIESSTLYQEMIKRQPGSAYDPECLDSYSLDWKSLRQPANSYASPLSQLTALCKRPPPRHK